MHLTDERVFNIGDSVYAAIANADGFATEIDPQQFTPFIIDETKKTLLNNVLLKDEISKEEFNKYGKLLAKKLNKDEDDITTEDVLREKNKWIAESYRTGKMQTFLDVYLFDVARRQGKWMGGVEDLKDQEDIMDVIDESDLQELAMNDDAPSKEKIDKSAEDFITTYTNADLNAIDSISNLGDSLYEDALLVKRNRKMAMRMDSLSHVRSMVFAIGAAHLPGNKGLIRLLQQKGFTVTPVLSSKKIKPKDYKLAAINLPWKNVKDEDGFYNVFMPGNPGDLTMYGVITMKMYFDVFNSTVYMTTALRTPYTDQAADSVFNVISNYYFTNGSFKKSKQIVLNGVPGRELTSYKENYSHGYLLFKDGVMYMAIGMSMKNDTSAASQINRFIHSFTITQPAQTDNGEITFTNAIKAYQVVVPAQPKSANDMSSILKDSTTLRDINIVSDPASGAYLFFGTNEAAPGYTIPNDSSLFSKLKNSQKTKLKYFTADTSFLKDGRLVTEFAGTMLQSPLKMQMRYESRGNRWYILLALYDSAKPHVAVDKFFNSFSVLNYELQPWNTYAAANNSFTTWAPSGFTYAPLKNGFDSDFNYRAYDSTRADNFGIIVHKFTKYYWQKSDSALWSSLIKETADDDDTLLYKKPVTNGDAKGYEIETKQYGSNNIRRIRMLLNGDVLYKLYTIQSATEIDNTNNNKYFDDFRFKNISPGDKLFESKASILLNDISSTDSTSRKLAVAHLLSSPFAINDLPALHAALMKSYPDDSDYSSTKQKLKNIIIDLHDSSSYAFAKNNYANANDSTKVMLLNVMASFPTLDHFNDIKNLLLNQPPRIDPDYEFSNRFEDTMSLTAKVLPGLLPLLKDSVLRSFDIDIINKLLDSNVIDKSVLQPCENDILQIAHEQYKHIINGKEDYQVLIYGCVKLLGHINTTDGNALLEKLSVVKPTYIKWYAVKWLLRNKQTLNPLAIQALAREKDTRTELYDSLKAYKQEKLFPASYLTQKSFAESYAYNAADDDDDEPSDIIYLTQKLINFKGRQSRFYFFKITYGEDDDDDKTYSLACAGPFKINMADVSSDQANGDIYSDEDFDAANLPEQMNALVKQMEDWYKWNDEETKTSN